MLWLVATDGGDGITQDHSVWADAKLIAKDGTETYLSDLKPVSARAGWNTLLRDCDYSNQPLRIAGKEFKKGLFAHAHSVLCYRLHRRYARFEAWVGVNDTAGDPASVQFKALDRHDPAPDLWDAAKRDFPFEMQQMERDSGGAHLAWFRDVGGVKQEEKMIADAVEEIGDAANDLRKDLGALGRDRASAEDPRWLALYAQAAEVRQRFRTARAHLKPIDLPALRRAIWDLAKTYPDRYTKAKEYLARADACEKQLPGLEQALARGDESTLKKVEAILEFQREVLLANPLLDFDRLLLVKRGEAMLGLPANWQGNCALARTGYDNEIAVLSPVRPNGKLTTLFRPENTEFVGDVDLEFDAERMLFSMPGGHGRWQIWQVQADGSGLRQVTPGTYPDVDDYDACYLPDGRIIFASTRCFAGVPCVGGGNTVANLCIMDSDGRNVRQLCFDQDHNWSPAILNNGRVLYSRWEYSDTPHYFSRLLFHMNPDGTGQSAYYGSNSYWPNSIFYARAIPNHPTEVVAVISGHHGVPRMGELVLFDPAKGRFEADGVVQRIPGYGKKVEPVIADALVDGSWPKFLHPYPLSDKYFLVSCQPTAGEPWGIYLVDVFDNMLPILEIPGYAFLEPVPFRKTPRPPVVPDKIQPGSREATVYLADIYAGGGLDGIPRGTVKNLRIYEFHYGYPSMGGHINVGVEGAWDVHRIVGTVPVLEDGSANFKAPANTPLAVQPLDSEGRALQMMRSWFTAMPGEVLSCVGCHEQQNATPPVKSALATRRPPSEIAPWRGPTRGFSFKREVQPVLDKYCVGCHNDGDKAKAGNLLDFTAKAENGWGNFTPSYLALHPYVRRPGPESDYHMQQPMEFHASTSELIQMLEKGHHGVELDNEAWDRLATWIDLNVPDHGTWSEHRAIAADFRQRRLEMRTLCADRPEDPEAIPDLKREPVEFVSPKPEVRAKVIKAVCATWPFDGAEAQRRQSAAGGRTRWTVDLGEGVAMEFALIPAGEFIMGSSDGALDEAPATLVKVEKPFWMGVTEVTATQFRRFDPSHNNGFFDQQHKDHNAPGYPADGSNRPVIRISWNGARAFSDYLSEKTGRKFQLPTEAQWEWACRAGAATPFHYGDLDADFSSYANLADYSTRLLAVNGVNPQPIPNPSPYFAFLPKDERFNDGAFVMTDAGRYTPNAWGLRDMHGNVCEWTRSSYRPYPYAENDGRNDPSPDEDKVVRGGSWRDRPKRAGSAFRLAYRPYQRVFNVGFRVVCELETGKQVADSRE